jgi:signal transduction histidine kinase
VPAGADEDRGVTGLTIKAALFLGFGVTVAIWLIAGYRFTQRMAEVEGRASEINARYVRAQDLLSTVRAQVLLGSVYVRDALLDPDPTMADEYRQELEDTYRAVDAALLQYVPVLDTAPERERIAHLREEVDAFRSTVLDVLGTDSSRWATEARVLLRRRIMPKREGVIRLSEEVQAINRAAFVRQQTDIAAIYRDTQRGVWRQLGLALGASLAVALLATLYAGRLENRIRAQRVRDAQNARDLQRLSAKLISAQEDERRSIARELHDEVGQVLTAIKVELAVAQHAIEAAGLPAQILLDARSITDGALHTVRDLSHLLHPAMLDDLGLPATVEWYLRGFGKRHGIHVDLVHDRMEQRLSPETEAAAYRIIQEALTNVARHARATKCRVYLQRLPNTVLITIEDDGAGFEPAEADRAGAPRGLGFIGIRERAAQLRGTVRLESAPGKGTRVTVELPAAARIPDEIDAVENAAGIDGAPDVTAGAPSTQPREAVNG